MNDAVSRALLAAPAGKAPAAGAPRRGITGGLARLADALSSYLPVVVMGLLALGSWWLVKNTPLPDAVRTQPPPRHVPDYTMSIFTVQRYGADGALRVQLEGDTLRHYPDNDTLEVDNARIRAIAPNGRLTLASARHALSNGDGSQVQLSGGARVLRVPSDDPAAASGPEALEFRGEFLHAFLDTEQLRSHLPVIVTRGGTQLRGDSMAYDNLDRVLELKGRVHATFATVPPARRAKAAAR